jgi:sugar transferase (PEP-CTERM/EpsH1 system associated)
MRNGVDAAHFAPQPGATSPYAAAELPIVFTGTMDYRPNVDAVTWFASEVLPLLRRRLPTLCLSIVGRHPSAAVRALEGEGVRVTGAVDDVRPWLQHAAVAVVPMRLARGVQNKLLEAMAMGRPVVTVRDCAEVVGAEPGRHLDVAADAPGFAAAVLALLQDPERARRLGEAARRHVLDHLDWSAGLAPLDRALDHCLDPCREAP